MRHVAAFLRLGEGPVGLGTVACSRPPRAFFHFPTLDPSQRINVRGCLGLPAAGDLP